MDGKKDVTDSTYSAVQEGKRIIKRYSNRKLYDTKDSRYVTLQQIGEMIRAGEDVQIIDNKTKEDKTEVTLALILSEDLKSKPRSIPLVALRDLLQERGERLLSQLREGPIGRLIPGVPVEPGAEEVEEEEIPSTAPQPAPEGVIEPGPTSDDKPKPPRGRFNELVEGLNPLRDVRQELAVLTRRVEELESQVATLLAKRD